SQRHCGGTACWPPRAGHTPACATTSCTRTDRGDNMKSLLGLSFGVVAYTAFVHVFIYAIGFIGNIGVPKSIDTGEAGSLASSLLIDLVLLTIFAAQHSIMA